MGSRLCALYHYARVARLYCASLLPGKGRAMNNHVTYNISSIKGMTLRDFFAGIALAGLTAKDGSLLLDGQVAARACYGWADAMMAEREKKPAPTQEDKP